MAREMKDSGIDWIGNIPNDWSPCKIKTLASISSGDFISKDDYIDGGKFKIIGSNGEIGKTNKTNNQASVITTGRVGTIGTANIVKNAWITDNALILKPNNICIEYLCYVIPNIDFKLLSSGTAQSLITATKLKEQYIPYPELNEQRWIVTYLTKRCNKISDAISRHQSIIEKLEEYKKSTITQAVTKGLNPDVEMKDSGVEWIGKFPKKWDVAKNKFVFTIKKNIAGEEGHTVLSITQRGIIPKNLETNEGQLAANYANYQLVNIGDFAMNHMDLLTGWVDISKYEGVTSPDYRVFYITEPAKHYAPYYLYIMQLCYFNRIFYGLGAGVSGFGRWRLQAPEFLNFNVPIPPIYEQIKIAKYLDDKCLKIADAISRQKAAIEKLEEYRKSLIYNAVTGKIDCREAAYEKA